MTEQEYIESFEMTQDGLTAIIWEYPEENDLQWKVNVLDMEIGQYIYRKRFKTYEAARDFCLLVTKNRAA